LTFFPEFYAHLSRYQEMQVQTRYKTCIFSPPFCAPLAQSAKILTREIWVRPTYICKMLSWCVKVCRSYSRKADFEQMRITLSWHDSV